MAEYPEDVKGVKPSDLLESHRGEQVKSHSVLDAQGRAVFIFTAYIGAADGDPCMVDEFVYASPTSTQAIGRQERTYAWKAAWDTAFTFDPLVSYDPDGDGVL